MQVAVLSITEDHSEYVEDVVKLLRGAGIRTEADVRNEKIGYKIREHTLARIPFLLVAGARERETGSVALRSREGKDLGVLSLSQAVDYLLEQAQAPDHAERNEIHQALRTRLCAAE